MVEKLLLFSVLETLAITILAFLHKKSPFSWESFYLDRYTFLKREPLK